MTRMISLEREWRGKAYEFIFEVEPSVGGSFESAPEGGYATFYGIIGDDFKVMNPMPNIGLSPDDIAELEGWAYRQWEELLTSACACRGECRC